MSQKPKKHTRILRDNIHKITIPALQRICHRAGVQRISGSVYDNLRGYLKVYLEGILKSINYIIKYVNRRTILVSDLQTALEIENKYIVTDDSTIFSLCPKIPPEDINIKKGELNKLNMDELRSKVEKLDIETDGKTKKELVEILLYKKKTPGQKVQNDIKFYQEHSQCFLIPKAGFKIYVREVLQDYEDISNPYKISKKFFEQLQLLTENYLLDICVYANFLATQKRKKEINGKDIMYAAHIINGDLNPGF
jgi:histone H4